MDSISFLKPQSGQPSNLFYDHESNKRLKPLDLLLFKEIKSLSDGTKSENYRRAGILVNAKIFPEMELEKGKLYVYEINYIKNVETEEEGYYGIQVRDLELVIHEYKGKVCWCKLKKNPWLSTNPLARKYIINAMKEIHDQSVVGDYQLNPMALFTSIFPSMKKQEEAINKKFEKMNNLAHFLGNTPAMIKSVRGGEEFLTLLEIGAEITGISPIVKSGVLVAKTGAKIAQAKKATGEKMAAANQKADDLNNKALQKQSEATSKANEASGKASAEAGKLAGKANSTQDKANSEVEAAQAEAEKKKGFFSSLMFWKKSEPEEEEKENEEKEMEGEEKLKTIEDPDDLTMKNIAENTKANVQILAKNKVNKKVQEAEEKVKNAETKLMGSAKARARAAEERAVNGVMGKLQTSAFDKSANSIRDMTSFCSQFVALVYKRLGVYPKSCIPNKVSPSDLLYGKEGLPIIVDDPVYLRTLVK